MSNADILSMCFRNLFKRKLRTILTMLGVVIGCGAIVILISLGLANDMRFNQLLDGMGDVTTITVQNPANMWMREDEMADLPDLDGAAVEYFMSIPGVAAVTPTVQAQGLFFRSGHYGMSWSMAQGVRAAGMGEFGFRLEEGRLLQEGDVFEVVFGYSAERMFENLNTRDWSDRLWREMSGDEVETYVDIWNDRIVMSFDWSLIHGAETREDDLGIGDEDARPPLRPVPITVVGRLAQTGDWNIDGGVFIDVDLIQRMRAEHERHQQATQFEWLAMDIDGDWGGGRFGPSGHIDARGRPDIGYDQVRVRAANIDQVQEVREHITDMGYPAFSMGQHIEGMQGMAESQQQMLGWIGIAALIISAIGIANTMVMSTYERTREIGVMKVIGAAISDIRKMFLIEAAMIGFFGGLLGVAFSYLASFLLNTYTEQEFMGGMLDWFGEVDMIVSYIPTWLSALAAVFSGVVGLLSGYFPARRAMKLSALNAIRTE